MGKTFLRKSKIGNTPSDVAKLDIHDWYGNLIARFRAPATDKKLGAAMIMRLKEMFGMTDDDLKKWYDAFLEQEKKTEKEYKPFWMEKEQ